MRRLLPGIVLLLAATAVQAQPVIGAAPGVNVETRLVRDLNRYRYDGFLTFGLAPARWQIDGAGRFSSDAFEIFGGQLTFRDELEARFRALRTVSPHLALGARARTQLFSQSRVLNQQTVLVAALQPAADIRGEVEAGLALDQRPGVPLADGPPGLRTDAGPSVGARFAYTPVPSTYALDVRGHAGWAALTPRRSADAGLEVGVERHLETSRVALHVLASRVRRDAYQAASFLNRTDGLLDETVEATTSDTLLAAFELDLPVAGLFQFNSRVDAGVNARQVRTLRAAEGTLYFDTDFSRQALSYEGALLVERPGVMARLSLRTGAETERRLLVNRNTLPAVQAAQKSELLRQADHDRGFLTLAFALHGRRGRLTGFAEAAASILRHDTPEINFDDRDEAQQTLSAGLQWRLRPTLTLDASVFGSSYHTVYLKRQRSGENNRQRSLRLRPAATWTPAPLTRVVLTSEVRATYTTADVVLPGRVAEDQAARELRYELEAEHAFVPSLRLRTRATYSDLRLGRLVRERFAEIPFDTLRTYTLDLRLQVVRKMTAEVGVRLFLRRDYDRSVTVRYARTDEAGNVLRDPDGQPLLNAISRPGRSWRRQIGPVVRLSWPLGSGSAVELDGWYAMQRLSYTLFGTLPEASEPAIRQAARRGQRDLFPNLSLTVRWAIR